MCVRFCGHGSWSPGIGQCSQERFPTHHDCGGSPRGIFVFGGFRVGLMVISFEYLRPGLLFFTKVFWGPCSCAMWYRGKKLFIQMHLTKLVWLPHLDGSCKQVMWATVSTETPPWSEGNPKSHASPTGHVVAACQWHHKKCGSKTYPYIDVSLWTQRCMTYLWCPMRCGQYMVIASNLPDQTEPGC